MTEGEVDWFVAKLGPLHYGEQVVPRDGKSGEIRANLRVIPLASPAYQTELRRLCGVPPPAR